MHLMTMHNVRLQIHTKYPVIYYQLCYGSGGVTCVGIQSIFADVILGCQFKKFFNTFASAGRHFGVHETGIVLKPDFYGV